MRLYAAVTDSDWFALQAAREAVDEVNFWRPSPVFCPKCNRCVLVVRNYPERDLLS